MPRNIAIYDQEVCQVIKYGHVGVVLRPTHSSDEADDFWIPRDDVGLNLSPTDADLGDLIDSKF